MFVTIKDLSRIRMEVKNKGVELEIRNSANTHLGDLVVRKSGLLWCPGRTRRSNGRKKSWKEFIAWMMT